MEYFQLANGDAAGFDNPADAPAGATPITAEQFAAIATTPALTLAQAQAAQVATLTADCRASILSGFTSSALGATYTYPSDQITQGNQGMVANSPVGGGLWCSASATGLTGHTQAQAQQVCADFVKWLNACQQRLVTLNAQVNAATTVAGVQAVSWAS